MIGKTHLLLLHFPIGVLWVIGFLELTRKWIPVEQRKVVTLMLLAVGAAASILTVATGLVYASHETWRGHTAALLDQHRFAGITTAVLAIAALVAYIKSSLKVAYLPVLVVAIVGVTFTGHRGGELVHGDGYLFRDAEEAADDDGSEKIVASDGDEIAEERERHPEGQVPAKPEYAKDIKPMFDRSCTKCHGPEKRKGGLRLDKKRFAMKGGETGVAILPGDPAGSLLIRYVSLPPDDEDVMPSKGKLLAQSEIETLKKWIADGAQWPDD